MRQRPSPVTKPMSQCGREFNRRRSSGRLSAQFPRELPYQTNADKNSHSRRQRLPWNASTSALVSRR
jgi:hypothetical protein